MNLSFEEGVFAGLLFLLGLLLGMLLRGGGKWRRRHDELHERHRSVEAERDGWRARHDALEGERETWARERAEWQRHHATAPVAHDAGVATAAGVGATALHGHPDNVAPFRREATVERTTDVRRLSPGEVRTVELGDARQIDEGQVDDGHVGDGRGGVTGGTAAPREGFAPSYPQRSEVKPD